MQVFFKFKSECEGTAQMEEKTTLQVLQKTERESVDKMCKH